MLQCRVGERVSAYPTTNHRSTRLTKCRHSGRQSSRSSPAATTIEREVRGALAATRRPSQVSPRGKASPSRRRLKGSSFPPCGEEGTEAAAHSQAPPAPPIGHQEPRAHVQVVGLERPVEGQNLPTLHEGAVRSWHA